MNPSNLLNTTPARNSLRAIGPSEKVAPYSNSLAGRLLSRTWDRGITTGYNEGGDLETVDYSDSTADVTYGYDRLGRKTNAVQVGMTTEFRYNDAGRLLSESYVGGPLNGVIVTNTYDASLRRTNLMASASNTPFLQHSYTYGGASRLSIVSDGTNSATYGYLAKSPLVETITFKQNNTTRMVTEKTYDYLSRLTSITHSTNNVALAEYVYEYNDANQRVRVDEVDGSYWIYEYDALGQVKSGKKYWSDGTPVGGQQFVYSHDDIGNRKHVASGGNEWGSGLRYAHYNVNSVNQYTSRTVPGAVDVIGTANSNSTVTVNNQPTYRKGEYFRTKLTIDNRLSAISQGVTNLAVLNNSPGSDITTNNTGNVLVPQTPETFLYDTDGNLIRDGLWTNIWNGENRLVRTESLSTVPEAARTRVEWTHLPDGRWIERIVSAWVSGAYVPQSTNHFVWDSQVLLGILNEQNVATLSLMRGLDLSGKMQGAGGVGGLLAVTDHAASGIHFAGNDANGNPSLLVKAADSVESARYAYSPFGETLRATGDMAKKNPIRFSTQLSDDVRGVAKFLFREYRPITGRWLSRDPIEERGFQLLLTAKSNKAGDINDSLFVRNDPIRFYDLFGLSIADVANMYSAFVDALKVMCACHLSCPEKGWAQNLPPYVYWGCTRQTEHLQDVLDKVDKEHGWNITVNYDTSTWPLNHNSVRVMPENAGDPVIDADTWKGCFSATWPEGSSQEDFKKCFTCKELLKK